MRIALVKAEKIIDLFRGLDSTLPTQVVAVFLAIAKQTEPLETRRLPDMVGLSQSSINRALTYLQDTHWSDRHRPGLKLIDQQVSRMDARQRVVELTPKGRKLANQIEEIIAHG